MSDAVTYGTVLSYSLPDRDARQRIHLDKTFSGGPRRAPRQGKTILDMIALGGEADPDAAADVGAHPKA